MQQKPVVFATRRMPVAVEAALAREFDTRGNLSDERLDESALRIAFAEADAVIPTIGDRVTAAAMDASPLRARIIANFGVGTDHIDLGAARARGLVVTNTPGVLTDCTADLTMALMLAVMRRLGDAEHELRAGEWAGWRPVHIFGTRVSGKTLGLIGFGRIGRAVARRASAGFGMRVLFHTPHPPSPETCAALGAEPRASVEDVLEECDVVSLHAPATPATHHLLDDSRLARLRPHAVVINTARGELLDEAALVAALQSGRIAGAGLDVYENEPRVSPALLAAPNVVLLPHIGSATLETRTAMGLRVLANLRACFAGATPPDIVSVESAGAGSDDAGKSARLPA